MLSCVGLDIAAAFFVLGAGASFVFGILLSFHKLQFHIREVKARAHAGIMARVLLWIRRKISMQFSKVLDIERASCSYCS
jgi:hypothetical protein